ncbi:MAG: 16S rRNA (guanine(966)-N(2))-methyltransferase RsmD [Clostridia bacterium]
MRIIAGEFGGRNLIDFNGKDIRPTSEKAREAFFSIVRTKIRDCEFLDLFAGTGSMGFEALSRGAKNVVMSDMSKQSCQIIQKNADNLKCQPEIYNIPAMYVLNKLSSLHRQFDIIFLDPPYRTTYGEEAAQIIADNRLLKDDGILVLEQGEAVKADAQFKGLTMYDKRKYGIAIFRFYKYTTEEALTE